MGYYHVGIQGLQGFRGVAHQLHRTLLNQPHARTRSEARDHRNRISGSTLVVGAVRATLRQGATGPLVMELQRKLGLPVDSIFGVNTSAAVRGFQSAHGLQVDGVVGPNTWSALDQVTAPPAVPVDVPSPEPTLQEGSIGAAVIELQHRLNLTVDGIFGPDTKNAVLAFQNAHGLQADGIVGPLTWGQLKGATPPVPAAPGATAVDTGTTGAPPASPTPSPIDQPSPVNLPDPQEPITNLLRDVAAANPPAPTGANTPGRSVNASAAPTGDGADAGSSLLPAAGVAVALGLGLAVVLAKKKRHT